MPFDVHSDSRCIEIFWQKWVIIHLSGYFKLSHESTLVINHLDNDWAGREELGVFLPSMVSHSCTTLNTMELMLVLFLKYSTDTFAKLVMG